jgi:hypothetical protein
LRWVQVPVKMLKLIVVDGSLKTKTINAKIVNFGEEIRGRNIRTTKSYPGFEF